MRTKRKLSVTVDEDIFQSIDKAAKACDMAKSQLAQEAFRLWIKKRTQDLMAQGYEEMAKEDREFAELAIHAQEEILR
jgi:predicted transcriptional regulator